MKEWNPKYRMKKNQRKQNSASQINTGSRVEETQRNSYKKKRVSG